MKHNSLAARLLAYLAGLTITQGRFAGQPFPIFPWQKRFVIGAFGDAIESAISVARANGKTTLVAGLACASLDGPLAQPRGETVVVASSFEQACITFRHVLAFLREKYTPEVMADRSLWRIQDSANKAQITYLPTGSMVKCIGSDPRRAHGLAPSLLLLDEGAQFEPSTADRMLAALRTALGKLAEYRLIALGTKPADSEHWFTKMLEGGADYCQCHAASPKDGKFSKRTWHKANPSLKYLPDLMKAIEAEAEKARRDPALLASFEALRLNLGTPDTVRSVLLPVETWASIEGEAEAIGRPYWGIDLGTSAAQSAITSFWPKTGRLECLAAFPYEPSLSERGLRDGVGDLYVQCHRRGELIQSGEYAVELRGLLEEALDRFGLPAGIASDYWREAELRQSCKAAGIPLTRLELRRMGWRDGSEDVRLFRRWCLEGKVTPIPSLLLASAIGEARTVSDVAGNSKLAKGTEGGRRLRARDDAAAAGILGVGIAARQPERTGSVYHGLAG